MKEPEGMRVDRWLWCVRLFKTRSNAIQACKAGHVKAEGQSIKASRLVRVGEVLTVRRGEITRTVRVTALLDRRVGAARVPAYMEDRTPHSEYQRLRDRRESPAGPVFPKGSGRPTKRQRRLLDRWTGSGRPMRSGPGTLSRASQTPVS